MIDHITLSVSNFEKSKKFYLKALKPLGYKLLKENKKELLAGFGKENLEGKRDFWIKEKNSKKFPSFSCLAFTASSKKMVDGFYKAAIKAGGKDNGSPGYRKNYHPKYYSAFVLDPDGHNIEAVYDEV